MHVGTGQLLRWRPHHCCHDVYQSKVLPVGVDVGVRCVGVLGMELPSRLRPLTLCNRTCTPRPQRPCTQTWTDNMSKVEPPVVEPSAPGATSYTKITFVPDMQRACCTWTHRPPPLPVLASPRPPLSSAARVWLGGWALDWTPYAALVLSLAALP